MYIKNFWSAWLKTSLPFNNVVDSAVNNLALRENGAILISQTAESGDDKHLKISSSFSTAQARINRSSIMTKSPSKYVQDRGKTQKRPKWSM